MRDFYATMERWGFAQGNGQVTSRHLQLTGYQCQPEPPEHNYLRQLLIFVAQQTGWNFHPRQMAALGGELTTREGQRHTTPVATVWQVGLDAFVKQRGIFSYVFTSARRMNYTVL